MIYPEMSLSVVFLMNMKLDRNLDPVSKSPLFFVRVGELVFLGLLLVIPGTNFYSNINLDPKTKGVNEIEKLIPTSEYPVNKTGVELGGLSAEAAIVMDIDSAVMLYEKNSRERLYPASTTKMMTAVIAIENYPLEKVVGVGKFDVPQYKIGLMEGENISVENLLYGTLVASGNDAAEALASTFPGGRDEFILAMNQKAKELHLLDTQFRNPTGVDEEGHFSTALDLGRLAIYALGEPVFSRIVATQKTSVYSEDGKIEHKLSNINSLLGKLEGVKGIKTGYTEKAGESLVALTERKGHKILTVVLGSMDRFSETENLIEWAFSNHDWISPEADLRREVLIRNSE